MANETATTQINSLLAEFGTRLNEVEEKHRIIRDRALLIGENFISTKEELEKQIFELKNQINSINLEMKNIKKIVDRVINELPAFARKTELEILENQAKMFQPLELARIEDIEDIIEKKLKNKSK